MTTIFLDLDGTLTDPKPGITKSIVYSLERIGHAAPDPDELVWAIGPPLWDTFRELDVPEPLIEPAVQAYRERYTDVGLYECTLYPGILETLEELADAGFQMNLATSKPHSYTRKITAHFGVAPFLTHEFGSELDGTNSDKSDLLGHGLAISGANPAESVMIGDRKFDAIGAAAHNITMIGALWGYGGAAELAEAGVDILAETPAQIPDLIRRLRASS